MKREELLKRVNEKLRDFGKLLFLTKAGSHLYGTNTPESDEDYVGVFLGNPEFYIGMKNVKEVDCSIKDKDESGKNTKDAVDIKVYELRQFLKLAGDVNPNIVELLFAKNKDVVIFNTPEFEEIQNNYHLFINRRVFDSFQGYARQQMKKGISKAENLSELKEFKNTLLTFNSDRTLAEFRVDLEKYGFKVDDKNVYLKNLTFPLNYFVKKVEKMVEEKLHMASHRAKMWEKYGYDTKFFMHLFRLLNEGEDLISKGKLEFPVREKEFLLDVRKGKFSLEELQKEAEKRFERFKVFSRENLPNTANWNEIEKLLMKIVRKKICNS